jgi:[ribosomal protein S5]-alanine N-acetyltransferase
VTVLTTARLTLRELGEDDAPFIFELLNEDDFLRFIGDKGVRNLSDAREYIRKGPVDSYGRHGFGLYAVCVGHGVPMGICGLVKREGLADPDLGFSFLERHRAHGYALESARAVVEQAHGQLKLPRILAITTPDNERSVGLLTKAGFIFERMIRLQADSEELKLFANTMPVTER